VALNGGKCTHACDISHAAQRVKRMSIEM
jgi:hypothetical protein